MEKLKITDYNQIYKKFPALSAQQVKDIKQNVEGALRCTNDNFRIAFDQPWIQFYLNREAATVFVTHFIRVVRGGKYSTYNFPDFLLTEESVRTALNNHVPYLKRLWKTYKDEATKVRSAEEKLSKQRESSGVYSRKKTVRTPDISTSFRHADLYPA